MVQQAKKKRFVVDEKGNRTDVILPLEEYEELLEDLEDLAAIAKRRDEPSVSFREVKARLERKWRLTESK